MPKVSYQFECKEHDVNKIFDTERELNRYKDSQGAWFIFSLSHIIQTRRKLKEKALTEQEYSTPEGKETLRYFRTSLGYYAM